MRGVKYQLKISKRYIHRFDNDMIRHISTKMLRRLFQSTEVDVAALVDDEVLEHVALDLYEEAEPA